MNINVPYLCDKFFLRYRCRCVRFIIHGYGLVKKIFRANNALRLESTFIGCAEYFVMSIAHIDNGIYRYKGIQITT